MKRGDLAISALILIALTWFTYSTIHNNHSHEEAAYATIYVNGEHYDNVSLTNEEQMIEIKTAKGYNLLKVHEHGIEMIESNCPDHICIGFGHIRDTGDNIVCLPNRIFVEIHGAEHSKGVDAIVS